MPFYVVEPKSCEVQQACEKSPTVSLLTDSGEKDDIPAAVREASDRIQSFDLAAARQQIAPSGANAAILWFANDRLREGSSPNLRWEALLPGRRTFVPVHLPGSSDMELVSLQPRIWKKGQDLDITQSAFRISGAVSPSPATLEFLRGSREYWAALYLALLQAQEDRGAAIERLSQMWRDRSMMAPTYAALLVRNLVVLSFREEKLDAIEQLLNRGMDCYPRCADLACLSARIAIERGNLRKAEHHARQARMNPDPKFAGEGGEGSYRAFWLEGLTAELTGKQAGAVRGYLPGVLNRPAFPPSVYGILRQRLPRSLVSQMYVPALVALARREPQYSEPVFHFLLLHGQNEALRRLLNSHCMAALQEKYHKLLDEELAGSRPAAGCARGKPGVKLSGPFYVHSSLGRINREMGAALATCADFEMALEPSDLGDALGIRLPHYEAISNGLKHRLSRPDLTIRQQWPPDFSPPESGKLVAIVPWEFGAVPCKWVDQIQRNVEELWVPSQFTRSVFAGAGVDPRRMQVIPYGIDSQVFTPEGLSWRPESSRRFVFLFVGGAIPRKGADVLWKAYASAFSITDDVTLIIKEIGASSFYSGQSIADQIRAAIRKPRSPHVVILDEEMDDAKLATLYRGSDVLVLPYRGEGFGLPLLEALACGKPVITSGSGPAREFCPPEAGRFLSAPVKEFSNPQELLGPMTGINTLFEPDAGELAAIMRSVFENPEELAAQGLRAASRVREELSWARITPMYIERIRRLLRLGVRCSGSGIRESGFEIRDSLAGTRDPGLGNRVPGPS